MAIQRGKSAMLRAVLPGLSGRQAWLVQGGHSEACIGQLPSLEEEPAPSVEMFF